MRGYKFVFTEHQQRGRPEGGGGLLLLARLLFALCLGMNWGVSRLLKM